MNARYPAARPRRLRRTPALRRLVAENRVRPEDLILPVFVKEGITEPNPVTSMPGVVQHTRDSVRKAAQEAAEAGVGGIMLFGIPESKDERGSAADDPGGIVQCALRDLSADLGGDIVILADLCLDEYTSHGHCGLLTAGGEVDNDATLERYASVAVAQAAAGAEVVGPSGMMDGQVAAVRSALDDSGYADVAVLAYAAKYSSAFYGPFRDAVESSLSGDRRTYQQDPANAVEALREIRLDVDEGADMVMIKPAAAYLDIVARAKDAVDVPVAAYQVSGEYAMIEAAAAQGWIDRDRAVVESLTAMRRAGADIVLTYWAVEAAQSLL